MEQRMQGSFLISSYDQPNIFYHQKRSSQCVLHRLLFLKKRGNLSFIKKKSVRLHSKGVRKTKAGGKPGTEE
jgi:hypothetical protein